MRLGDILWLAGLGTIVLFLLLPETNAVFVGLSKARPYTMGFVKFAVLATMGELLALRIVTGAWKQPPGLVWRAAIWGLLGVVIVLVFDVFGTGVTGAVQKGLLPVGEGPAARVMTAFWISTMLNLVFAPTMMGLHRVTDTYLDLAGGSLAKLGGVTLRKVVGHIDWHGFVGFVLVRTIPFFWIPAHTVTFLLPPEYRVIMAAFLSIALGAILAFAKRRPALHVVK